MKKVENTRMLVAKNSLRSRNKNSMLLKSISHLANKSMCLVSRLSPRANTELRYWLNYRKRIRLHPPVSFIEKCNWYKLHIVNKNDIFRTCSDKYTVRQFVEKRGCGEYLNELICVFDNPEAISLQKLPDQFAMKINDGAGYYLICTDKSKLDEYSVREQFKKWWKINNYLLYSEMQNRANKRMIIVEKYISDLTNSVQPVDYKFYCFDGKPVAILVVWERESEAKKIFMSIEWQFLSYAWKGGKAKIEPGDLPEKPRDLNKMVECAEKLSKGFPFVRVDLYQGKDGPVFGELTFTCAGAMFTAETDPDKLNMAELFKVPAYFDESKV